MESNDRKEEILSRIKNLYDAAAEVLSDEANLQRHIDAESHNNAPIIVHQRFCHELVEVGKKNEGKNLDDVPEFKKILSAIEFLEQCYPRLKEK